MLVLLGVYALLLMVAVLGGCYVGSSIKPTHRRTQFAMSFVSGLMLGIAVFHLLPHALYGALSLQAFEGSSGVDYVAIWLMAGLVSLFLMQRLFHFHQHDFDDDYCLEHDHQHEQASASSNTLGVMFGLSLHSLIDGVALGAAIIAGYAFSSDNGMLPAGFGVFLAIMLHKPLDALTINMFLSRAGMARTRRYGVLTVFSLLCPVMAFVVVQGALQGGGMDHAYIVAALSFSAGIFLCIALSDLLPELHFHSHDRLGMTLVLLAGILLSLAIKFVESEHSHQLKLGDRPHSITEQQH